MSIFAVIRVFAAVVIAFLLPAILRQRRKADAGEGWLVLVSGFAVTTALLEVFALTMAKFGLPYSEGLLGLWFVIAVYSAFGFGTERLRQIIVGALKLMESEQREPAARPAAKSVTRATLAGLGMAAAIFIQRAWFPLHYWRFETLEGYERTFSLFQIAETRGVNADGSLPLLALLKTLGGLDAAAVVRFADPLFSTLVCVAAGLFAYTLSKRPTAALLALALTAGLPVVLHDGLATSSAAIQMATLFWLVAGILAYNRRWTAVAAIVTAVLTAAGFVPYAVLAAGCVGLAVAIDHAAQYAPGWVTAPVRAAIGLAIAGFLVRDMARPVPDGPYQYEAAAATAERIAQTFPRAQWFIVSPTHELTSILGRGWHVELIDFLKDYNEESVAPPDFKFPWEADIFIFAESKPLTRRNEQGGLYHGGHGLGMIQEKSVLAYGTPLGRADTQFRLARVIAAYGRSHDNVSTFYQDDKLTVYRISRGPASLSAQLGL